MRVRRATGDDLPGLGGLMAGAPLLRRYGVDARRARGLAAEALRADDLILVAVDGGAPIGLAWVIPGRALDRTAYLRLLLVAEGARSRGVGRALLDAAERRSLRRGARHLALLVTRTNAGARRFYARQGYRHLCDLPGFVRPGLTESLYLKARLGDGPAPRRTR